MGAHGFNKMHFYKISIFYKRGKFYMLKALCPMI